MINYVRKVMGWQEEERTKECLGYSVEWTATCDDHQVENFTCIRHTNKQVNIKGSDPLHLWRNPMEMLAATS